jgi:hypothetical protein
MAAAILFLLIVVVIGGIGINLYLRSWVREESQRQAHLRDPDTHTVAYAIPNGMDPATIESALARAGLTSGVDRVGMVHCVRIECNKSQREQVRGVLEAIPMNAYDGSQLQARHVVFEDES